MFVVWVYLLAHPIRGNLSSAVCLKKQALKAPQRKNANAVEETVSALVWTGPLL